MICISGYPGSGKSIFADVGREMGIKVFRMGDVVREKALEKYGRLDKESIAKTSIEIREELGDNAVAILLAKKIMEIDDPIVIIDGVRSMEEVKELSKAGRTYIISLVASRRERLSRLLKRGREDDVMDIGDFMDREYREKGFGLDEVMDNTDLFIYNEDISLEELRGIARETFQSILKRSSGDHR